MKASEIIEEILKSLGWTQTTLAGVMGFRYQSYIGNALKRKNGMRVDTFVKMLNAMGYDVVVQSKNPNANKNKWVLDLAEGDDNQ